MILITGASSGIGEACARVFAEQGHPLILIARREEKLKKLAQKLRTDHKIEIHPFALDIQNRASITSFVEHHQKLLSNVKALINNAGLAKGRMLFQEGILEDWETMIDTNLKGVLYITRLLIPFLLKQPQAQIVNLGSVAGRWIYPMGNVYCATKSAIHALSEALRLDLNGTRIRVTEIVPGMVNTEFSEVRLGDKAKADAVYAGMTPLTGRDVAEAIAWCITRPSHVCIQELVIYPTEQASPTVVSRSLGNLENIRPSNS